MYEFVQQMMNHSMLKQKDKHINIDAFPSRALLEGIINAVAHRDYFMNGTKIQMDMFRDRLEISYPGTLIISKRRNEMICGIFAACNVMEASGTGFDKITEEYASDHFTLVLPDLTYEKGVQESGMPLLEYAPVPNGTDYDEKVLSYCYPAARKASDIASYLKISDSSYLRKKFLANLVENGYLLVDKDSRTKYYRTNPDTAALK